MSRSKLYIERLVIIAGSQKVYDEGFHPGVNILRGWNTTGKSTVMDLLVYGLGAEITSWNEYQARCDWVATEVKLNGITLTIIREITETGKAPMFFFDGVLDDALTDAENWQRFPNRRSDETHSYSQELFDLLGLPQHKTDDAKNLTMHQIFRLIYVDQLSATEKLFNSEQKFDNAVVRRAIGEYLLGLDDLESHNLRQDLIAANKEFETYNGELKAIYKMFGGDPTLINRKALSCEIEKIETELADLTNKRIMIQSGEIDNIDEKARVRVAELQSDINQVNSEIEELTSHRHSVNAELIDTKQFLVALEYRISSLSQSKLTNNQLGDLTFKYCPSCLNPVIPDSGHASCCLCKTNLKGRERDFAYVQMSNELNFQVRESKQLIEEFHQEVDQLNGRLPVLNRKLAIAKDEHSELLSYSENRTALIADVSVEIGYMKSQIINIQEKMVQVDKVEALINRKQLAQTAVINIEKSLEQLKAQNRNRYEYVFDAIEQKAMYLLQADGSYESDFDNPSEILIDFSKDRMAVNGRSKFSASSMVVMKNSIRLAIFLHAVDDDLARLPNILIIDNIEDKGMVPERSQCFQHALVDACNSLKSDYQVIFTTSMIADDLNDSPSCVGPYYPKGAHTLNIS
jgi:hypothetical protein